MQVKPTNRSYVYAMTANELQDEYALIQAKTSKLCKAKRDIIVKIVEG